MVTPERFEEVLTNSEGKNYLLRLGVGEVTVLHGLIALAMDHPGVQEQGLTPQIGRSIRDRCLDCFRDMGFSDEEVAQLDVMREEKTNELRLGPRLLITAGKVLGTCDDLSLTIAEATDQEIEELQSANEISLVKMAKE